jgi:acetate kinase
MRILVLNSGSSTLKFDLFTVDSAANGGDLASSKLVHGSVDRIGSDNATFHLSMVSTTRAGNSAEEQGEGRELKGVIVRDHREAVSEVFKWLRTISLATDNDKHDGPRHGQHDNAGSGIEIDAVGHRVVSGGDRYREPAVIDDAVLASLDSISELAPLHNPPALLGIRAAREVLGPSVPMVAVFDTAFHSTLPDYAHTYALPHELVERHGIRRYGFHGTAHEYMLRRYAAITGTPQQRATIVTLQLGNGCSAAAIRDGRSIDTSMGFTPLEGLVMGTRSGDLDPAIVGYLAAKESVEAAEIESLLNRRSGLLGISGRSSDMRDLLQAEDQDARARLAVEVFCYRVRKYIGAYLAALGGAQALVFGGGIGEHAPTIRASICAGMEWCGLRLDPDRNSATTDGEGRISPDDAQIAVYVVPVDESILIAQYTAEYVSRQL